MKTSDFAVTPIGKGYYRIVHKGNEAITSNTHLIDAFKDMQVDGTTDSNIYTEQQVYNKLVEMTTPEKDQDVSYR